MKRAVKMAIKRTLKITFVFVSLFSGNRNVQASVSQKQGLTLYVAAGPNFVFPTSVRVGWNRWELGLLTRSFVGFNKTFPISGRSSYAGFGIGFNSDPFQTNLGFQAALGYNYELPWNIGLRGEILANANLNGSTMSHALLGVSYGF